MMTNNIHPITVPQPDLSGSALPEAWREGRRFDIEKFTGWLCTERPEQQTNDDHDE